MQFKAISAIFAICSNLQQSRWVYLDISRKLTKKIEYNCGKLDKIRTNWWKLAEIGWNWLKLRGGEILRPFFLQGNLRAKFMDETFSKCLKNWTKLGKIGWNWVKLGKIARRNFCNFLDFCNFMQFQAILANFCFSFWWFNWAFFIYYCVGK